MEIRLCHTGVDDIDVVRLVREAGLDIFKAMEVALLVAPAPGSGLRFEADREALTAMELRAMRDPDMVMRPLEPGEVIPGPKYNGIPIEVTDA